MSGGNARSEVPAASACSRKVSSLRDEARHACRDVSTGANKINRLPVGAFRPATALGTRAAAPLTGRRPLCYDGIDPGGGIGPISTVSVTVPSPLSTIPDIGQDWMV